MRRKTLFIINPKAGTLKGKRDMKRIVRTLEKGGCAVDVMPTEARGDATRYAAQAEGYDLIICCGGDGTLNETVTGLFEREDKPLLGYIPAGSANDFGTSLRLSSFPVLAAKQILTGLPRVFDAGKFRARGIPARYFTYIASFGAFTAVSYSTPQPLKNIFGHLIYILSGTKEIANIHPISVVVETPEVTLAGDYIFGAISNSTSIAGLIKLDPEYVNFDDGEFEIMLIRSPKNIIELNKIINSLITKNYDPEVIDFIHSDKVTISSPDPMPWTLDGEYAEGATRVDVENIHDAFTLITPNDTEAHKIWYKKIFSH